VISKKGWSLDPKYWPLIGLLLVLGACSNGDLTEEISISTAVSQSTSTSTLTVLPSTTADLDSESVLCEPAPFRVTILPWLEAGEPLPEPNVELDVEGEGSSILTWEGPPGTSSLEGGRGHVAIVRYPMPSRLGELGHPVDIPVRDTLGEIQWVGDPGVGEVRLVWLEVDGDCGSYALYLWDITMTEAESEEYLREAAASLTKR
jgi:hypothetical protein